MADARREHEYDVAIATVCYFGGAMSGSLRPTEANPYRERPPKTPEEREEESREGWEFLKSCLKQVAGQRG